MAARRAVAMGSWATHPSPLWPWRGLSTRKDPPDPHSVLGVRPGASPKEIRAAFLARCKEVHPDGDPSDPSRHGRFLLLAEAYAALSSPRARSQTGDPHRDPTRGHPETPPHPGTPPRSGTPPRRGQDWNRRYWEQFPPTGSHPRTSPRRLLALLLLLVALGGVAHGLAYRYVAGAHAAFLDEQDRELRAIYERVRSRAGSREEVMRRLRAQRRGRGGGGGEGGEGGEGS